METFRPIVPNQRACGSEKDRDIIWQLYAAWESILTIARQFGVNDWVIRNIFRRYKLPIRSLHAKGNPHRRGHSPTKGKTQDPEVVRRRAEGTKRFYQEHPEARLKQRQNGLKLAQSPYHHRRIPGEYILPQESRNKISKTLIQTYRNNPEIKATACASLEKGRRKMGLGKGPTKLEQKVEKFLTTLSSSVTPQYRLNGFFVDFALPKQKLAVLADGCFWHCCPIHFPMAASRSQQHTLAVDKKRDKALKRAGWRILHIWECEIDKPATLEKLKKEVMSNAYPGCGN